MTVDQARQALAEAIALTIELRVLADAGLLRLGSPKLLFVGTVSALGHRPGKLDTLVLAI